MSERDGRIVSDTLVFDTYEVRKAMEVASVVSSSS